jgi:hypothetical protein
VMRGMVGWTMPAWSHGMDVAAFGRGVWDGLGDDVRKVMPWAVAGAGMVGMTMAAVWPRVAGRMFYSMLGVSVVVAMGAVLHQGSGMRALVPGGAYGQLALAGVMVATGMTVQWWLGPRRVALPAAGPQGASGDEE